VSDAECLSSLRRSSVQRQLILFGSGGFVNAYGGLWIVAFVACLSTAIRGGLSCHEIIVDLMANAKNVVVTRWLSIELVVFPCERERICFDK
jgi:hypothetical protein